MSLRTLITSLSNLVNLVVNSAGPLPATTTAVASSLAPSNYEDQVTFTITVTAVVQQGSNTPTGTVLLKDGTTVIATLGLIATSPGAATATATFDITTLTAGIHSITAHYNGDLIYGASTSPVLLQQVNAIPFSPGILAGFALRATFDPQGDVDLPPSASLSAAPSSVAANESVVLIWSTLNVAKVRIQGDNGFDYQPLGFDTGIISTTGSGAYVVGNGFTHNITLTLTTYDGNNAPLAPSSNVTITVT